MILYFSLSIFPHWLLIHKKSMKLNKLRSQASEQNVYIIDSREERQSQMKYYYLDK